MLHMTQNVHLPLLCAPSFFLPPHFCFHRYSLGVHNTSLLLLGELCSSTQTCSKRHLNTHIRSPRTTGNYLQRMKQVRGVQIALWVGSAGLKMSIREAAIHARTSSPVLLWELQGADTLDVNGPVRTWVYLFVSTRQDDLPRTGEPWLSANYP